MKRNVLAVLLVSTALAGCQATPPPRFQFREPVPPAARPIPTPVAKPPLPPKPEASKPSDDLTASDLIVPGIIAAPFLVKPLLNKTPALVTPPQPSPNIPVPAALGRATITEGAADAAAPVLGSAPGYFARVERDVSKIFRLGRTALAAEEGGTLAATAAGAAGRTVVRELALAAGVATLVYEATR